MEPNELKKMAAKANEETWAGLQSPALDADGKDRMVASAYASLYLWENAGGTDLHRARGHWLISRVLCVVGEANLAARHAELCGRFTEKAADRKDFDEVYAVEAQARVAALKRDSSTALQLKSKAEQMAQKVKDPEDREIACGDVRSEPWFGLPPAH